MLFWEQLHKDQNIDFIYVGSIQLYCLFLDKQCELYENFIHIRKTCPFNVYPLEPHFYMAKLGYAGVNLIFLILLQNIDCGYSLEPHWQGGSNVYPQFMF